MIKETVELDRRNVWIAGTSCHVAFLPAVGHFLLASRRAAVRFSHAPPLTHLMVKPEHLFQPRRFLSRLFHRPDPGSPTARLSFGFELAIMPGDMMSNSVRRNGMYDITTAEVLYRLLDDGEDALDVGAHVGLMSIVMGSRAGRIRSVEPHPEVFARLRANAERLNAVRGRTVVLAIQAAASSVAGEQTLTLPEDWQRNTGNATLATAEAAPADSGLRVACLALDDLLVDDFRPKVMKIDVEGYELSVLHGAPRVLAEALRDIVFEDFGVYPTPVMRHLEDRGFSVFALSRSLRRPHISSPDRAGVPKRTDPNYLATRDPERASRRLDRSGWSVLRPLFATANRARAPQ